MRFLSKLVAAIVFIIVGFLALTPLGAGLGENSGMAVAAIGAILIGLAAVLAPTGRRAWGRGFLLNGVLFVAMPLLVLPLLGSAYTETVNNTAANSGSAEQAATEAGAAVGAALMFGAFSFVGLILGEIFVILGLVLVLGGRREVIVVEATR